MQEHLLDVRKPSHYIGSEWGAVRKDPARVRARVALAFPDLYEVGMSYLGQKILYEAVNRDPGLWAERVYAPARDTADLLRERGLHLSTLESGTPLGRLDGVAFSLTHELCYTNVLYMLDLAGLPLRASERDESHPLVMAGGGCAFNAEPLTPFLDLLVIGDGEFVLPRILDLMAQRRGRPRAELLRELAGLPGVYVPSFFEPAPEGGVRPLVAGYDGVAKALVPDLDQAPFPTRQVVSFGQAVHDRYILEIARGCTRGCRFCQAGMIYRPVRERKLPDLCRLVEEGLAETGFEELSFLSLSAGDFSALSALFAESYALCRSEQVAVSLPSMRVGSLNEQIMSLMASIRRTGATIAPEAGSQRLRDVINKGVTEEELLAHTETLFGRGWQTVKLYFMIGLPTETDDDLRAILDLCLKVVATAGKNAKRLQITASISPFVPKPHTPFQWEPQISLEEITRRVGLLRDLFRPYKRLKLRWHEPGMSFLEGIFSRGDRRLAEVVERAYRKGALFSSWVDQLQLAPWLEAMTETGLDPAEYLGARDPDRPLPWDHLHCGVTREFLLRERRRALSGGLSPDCRYGACLVCGVCDTDRHASTLGSEEPVRQILNFDRRDQGPGAGDSGGDGTAAGAAPAAPEEDLAVRKAAVRVFYRKLGPASCLSQLELQSVFERSLRRARIPMSFSSGFHPMPLISFGRALPVGVHSLDEWFNLFLRREMEPAAVAEALKKVLPRGLYLTRVEPIEPKRRQPQAVQEVFLVRYRADAGEFASLLADWERFLASDSVVHVRHTAKGDRSVDLRPLVAGAGPEPGAGRTTVRLTLDWRGGYLNPLALVQAVHGRQEPVCLRLVKTSQVFEAGPDTAE